MSCHRQHTTHRTPHTTQVRRVEEQNQVLGLLPLYANKIYDCAVKVLPSSDAASISER